MSPFDRSPSHRIITSTISWTLLAATLILVVLLISSAGDISDQSSGTVEGPLRLFALSKTPLAGGGGTQVSMAALPGLAIYAAGAMVLAGFVSVLRLRQG